MTHAEIIAALQNAKGPDRALDAAIEIALTYPRVLKDETVHARTMRKEEGHPPGVFWYVSFSGKSMRTADPYTASLDAIVALVESKRRGWSWSIYSDGTAALWENLEQDNMQVEAGATPAIALCIALMKSMEDKDG